MGGTGLLRGSRKWLISASVVLLLVTLHIASRLYSNHPYYRWSTTSNEKAGSSLFTPEDTQPETQPETLSNADTAVPEYVSDVHKGDDVVVPALAEAQAMPSPTMPPHRYASADDFLPLIRTISDIKNLTLQEAAAPCDWSEDELQQYPWGSNGAEYIVNPRPEWELDLIRSRWQDFVKTGLLPYPKATTPFEGRGVVIVGGHPKSLKRIRVLIRALRELGSKLPVELHYWGNEMNETTKQGLREEFPTLFYLNDLAGPDNIYKSAKSYNDAIHINFQLKTSALINSRFAEPLLMDSDNIPAADPDLLFESETYKEHGTIFWPDIQRMHRENPVYAITNTLCRRDEYELESGQLIVDKRKYFYHLQLADWFLSQIYFGPYLLGDKDTFRFAWSALRTEYGRPKRWVTSVGLMLPREEEQGSDFAVEEFCGHSFAQHHPDSGEVAFVHGGTLKSFSAPLLTRLRAQGGLFKSYKRTSADQDWRKIEYGVHLKHMNATWMYHWMPSPDPLEALTKEDYEARILCTEMQNVEPRDGLEILPTFSDVFEKAGGYWPIDDGYRSGSSGA